MDLSPTDCEHVLRQIELFLDGELVGVQRLEIERHLGECSPCHGRSEFQRRLKELVRAKCGCDDVPVELLERVRALLTPVEPQPPAS
ncbi:MAG: mycothiol system anti-sigma-R factor [Actinomycetota bacterium]